MLSTLKMILVSLLSRISRQIRSGIYPFTIEILTARVRRNALTSTI